jgi:hypothetical protein
VPHVVLAKRPEADRHCAGHPAQHAVRMGAGRVAIDAAGRVRATPEYRRRGSKPAYDGLKRAATVRVAPLQIVDDDKHRTLFGDGRHHLGERFQETPCVRAGWCARRCQSRKIGA